MAFVVAACNAMGIEPLPVAVDVKAGTDRNHWAETCNTCSPRMWLVSKDLLDYNDAEWYRVVAYHEACHVYMGHDADWVGQHGVDIAEVGIQNCIEQFSGLSIERQNEIEKKAVMWLWGRK